MTTPSVEAYRLYSEALVARKNLRTADARELLEKAVALDPGFALAYMDLAIATNLLKDDAATRRYEAAALEHVDRLPPRQRLLVELTTARTAGESRKAVGFGERLVEQFPDEGEGFHMLAHAYGDLNDSAQSLRTWEAAIRVLPEAGNLHNEYGYALLDAGRYDEALRELEEYRRLNPREPNPYDSLGEARLVLGEPELALESYGTALTIDPQFFDSHVGRALAFSMRGRYYEALTEAGLFASALAQRKAPMARGELLRGWLLSRVGRYHEAEAALDRSRVEAVRVNDGEGQTAADLAAAVIALERGQLKRAQDTADRALARLSGLRERVRGPARAAIQFVAGVAEIRAGAVEAARRRLGDAPTPDLRQDRIEVWWWQALAAEVAVASGAVSEAAVALAVTPRRKMWFSLSQASLSTLVHSMPVRDTMARVQLKKGNLVGAMATYRELLSPSREQPWIAPLEPRFVLALARLLQRSGDAKSARVEYERFLTLWRDADSGAPEVSEARLALKSLALLSGRNLNLDQLPGLRRN
jgi:tetratricopeptide (TPR) repeat protein